MAIQCHAREEKSQWNFKLTHYRNFRYRAIVRAMNCPSCSQNLIVLELDNVEIDYCLACGGVWLDAGELSLLLYGKHGTDDSDLLSDGKRGDRRCPMCREKMNLTTLPKSGVEVDFCGRRHGLWLDKGELQQIINAEAADERVTKLREFCAKLFPEGGVAKR